MASRIKGITVEIGGDTTGLDRALKGVNSTIRSTQSQLKDVNKLLKLDPTNTNLVTQKQRLLKESIASTKEKLDALKTAQAQAKQQLENGTLGQDKYDALQREIVETEKELQRLQQEAAKTSTTLSKIDETGQQFEKVGDSITGAG
ncbi:MAG: phage tail tape measure protein, partial [Paenibacillus sp.]|nr:phage tail tape measure protein [Paenibacillus sp.]